MAGPVEIQHRFWEPTKWFNVPVTKDSTTAPTPGTLDATAAGPFGIITIDNDVKIFGSHIHIIHPSGSGSYVIELWRIRDSVQTLVASVTDDGSGGDWSRRLFTFVDESYKNAQRGDIFAIQPTSVMTGGGHSASAFIDMHFEEIIMPF